ncbi:MAG TPA: right-handed parallel beta-helix repeat-containing protein [Kofleriaceae bacterium]|nr:right-handed parallel beta-helix repeat-containing protein [Kofleriaceae bacterium]
MSPTRLTLAAALLLAAPAAGCKTDNPNFCDGPSCTDIDAHPIDAVQGCLENPSLCTADQTCQNDVCVDCEDNDNTQSAQCTDPAAPVCATDHTCRACTSDSECDSDWCEAGQCVAEEDVVYVQHGAADNAGCTLDDKCGSPIHGMSLVTATRKYMLIAADASHYSLPAALAINKDVEIRATGATLDRPTGNQVVDVMGGAVIIEGLTVRDAAGGANADGIKCQNATLTLRHVGVFDCADRGVDAGNCVIDISRSVLSGNTMGGARLVDGHFSVSNSFIIMNGANGGLTLNPDATPNTFEFNTIMKNGGGGVVCAGDIAITARNNLIHSNTGPAETTGANCTHSYTVFGPMGGPAGVMDRSLTAAEIGLVNANGAIVDDFHINTNANPPSLLLGAADPATPASVDYDGDPRTSPADIGADEVP